MNSETLDFDKLLKNLSRRHHYVPKFLIDGFKNASGLLFVYDKQKDEIFRTPRPPKSIFYQNERNTIELDSSTKSSVLEDLIYAEIDHKTSKVIKLYQTAELSTLDFKIEDSAMILFFLITLFWRIPKTDSASDDLMNRSTVTGNEIDPEIFKNDLVYRKLQRTALFKHHIDEMKKFGAKGKKWINVHQNENEVYLIGDYPILFKDNSNKFSEFNNSDILIAISSRRIYSSTNNPLDSFSTIKFIQI